MLSLIVITLITSIAFTLLWNKNHFDQSKPTTLTSFEKTNTFNTTVEKLDQAFEKNWQQAGIQALTPAPPLTIARRLSLALTGTIPSIEEIRAQQSVSNDQLTQSHLSQLFQDRRWSDYTSERLARSYVGTINGPFLVYRRRRLTDWLSKQLFENRPYDQLVRQLISAKGIWTSRPEVNFITVTIDENKDKKGPDEAKLAARVSRAFLGIRIDCMECHNDKFGDRWKQKDFHQLAAFFGKAQMSLTGIRDNGEKPYQYRYRGKKEAQDIPSQVPFNPEWLPATGNPREQLAQWVTHQRNRPFARSTVNRIWALLFNKPLVEPIDDIPLDGPWPAAMEILADELVAHDFDLQHLIRIIAATQVFQLDSRAQAPAPAPTEAHEKNWASFPLTRLRPEQVARSVIQSASITTIDAHSHIIQRLMRFFQQGDFLKRYGDAGENEFTPSGGTIPQRLLLMNGKLLHERTKENPLLNASTRIGILSTDHQQAVQTAYLAIFTRPPEKNELSYFTQQLKQLENKNRDQAMEDLFWILLNSTEFSWNH
ncbi:MAG: DUF1549 and DUF1553 domain-containing protein [Verrucomicrobiales bacterium]|nr:DUF1549 and DUF1553 domain-containing protein [Verrucomicrobiales bacterium]